MPTNVQPIPPNPSLLAVLLIAKTRIGPRLVLHYPPFPSASPEPELVTKYATSASLSEADDSDDSTNPGSSDDEVHVFGRYTSNIVGKAQKSSSKVQSQANTKLKHLDRADNGDLSHQSEHATSSTEKKTTRASRQRAYSKVSSSTGLARKSNASENGLGENESTIFGFSSDALAKLMAPNSRSWHRKKLEVSLESTCFLGCPIYCREDGTWVKRKRKREKKEPKETDNSVISQDDRTDDTTTDEEAKVVESASSPNSSSTHQRQISSISSTPSSAVTTSGASQANSNGLLMFNVVFVMMPPKLEHQLRVKEMYSHVAKTMANALKYRQRRDGYVWNETCEILNLREKAAENNAPSDKVWSTIVSSSSLAKALAMTYESISKSQIAHISLGAGFDVSLQIPQPTSTPFAPTPTAPQIPGLWLSSANLTGTYNDPHSNDAITSTSNDATTISPHAALLLLVPSDTLLKELSGSNKSPLSGPLSSYIKHSIPTRTISQLSKTLPFSVPDLQFLSLHLIRWRRARAIPPLHASHTYIISPNADMEKLTRARMAFSSRFSALPDLVSILHKLGQGNRESKNPMPWSTMIPSSDHKAIYMEALAWLVRGGWVCQLRTFAWVWVSSQAKRDVHRKMKQEERDAKAAAIEEATVVEDGDEDVSEIDQISSVDVGSDTTKVVGKNRVSSEESGSGGRGSAISIVLPQNHRKLLAPPHTGSSPSESVSSLVTAVRSTSPAAQSSTSERNTPGDSIHNKDESRQSALSPLFSAKDRVKTVASPALGPQLPKDEGGISPAITPVTSKEDEDEQSADFEPSLVLSPHKASTLESRWLEYIGENLDDKQLREAWPILVKHFDGRSAIEDISLIEEWKRKLVTSLITKLGIAGKGGLLRIIRHW